ncbi:hypothetical protein D9M68_673070 [compost metagenome]
MQRTQHEAQLRVVRAGELVELTGTRDFVEHLGKLGCAVHGVGKGLRLDHELGVLDLVERPGAVGQLHADLEGAVALPGRRRLPLAGEVVQAFDGHRLAAGAARRRHRRERGIARGQAFERDGRDDVDQRIEPAAALAGGHGHAAGRRQVGIEQRLVAVAAGHLARIGMEHRLHAAVAAAGQRALGFGQGDIDRIGLARRIAARHQGVVGHDGRENEAAEDRQGEGEIAHARACLMPLRPSRPPTPCRPQRCATRPAPAWSRRSAVRPFPWRSCCG